MNETLKATAANVAPNMTPAARGAMAVFLPIAAIIGAVVFVGWIVAMMQLITSHSIFGWSFPHHVPLWVGIVGLVVLYAIIATPLNAMRNSGMHAHGGYHPGWRALHTVIWIGFVALLGWIAYTFFPGVREVVDNLMWAANLTATTISETIA